MPQASVFDSLEKILAEKYTAGDLLLPLIPNIDITGRAELAERARDPRSISDRIELEFNLRDGRLSDNERMSALRYLALDYQRAYYSAVEQLEAAQIMSAFDTYDRKKGHFQRAEELLDIALKTVRRARRLFPEMDGKFVWNLPYEAIVKSLGDLSEVIELGSRHPENDIHPLINFHVELLKALRISDYKVAVGLRNAIINYTPPLFQPMNTAALALVPHAA